MSAYRGTAVRMYKIADVCMTDAIDSAQDWCEKNISGTDKELVSVSIASMQTEVVGNMAYALITYTEPAWFDSKTGKEMVK